MVSFCNNKKVFTIYSTVVYDSKQYNHSSANIKPVKTKSSSRPGGGK